MQSTPVAPSLAASIVSIMHQNMMMDPGDLNKKRVKKDVLWKPLLRGFRSYYRGQLNHTVNLQQVIDPFATDLTSTLEEQCYKFLVEIGAPKHITDNPLNLHALIVLAMPVAAKNLNRALRNLPRVCANLPRLISNFCSVFRENSKRIRASFFSNELIQLMWTRYIYAESEYVANYLSELINVENK